MTQEPRPEGSPVRGGPLPWGLESSSRQTAAILAATA